MLDCYNVLYWELYIFKKYCQVNLNWMNNKNISCEFVSHTQQLLFNEGIPASTINRATLVGPPAPIVIERLLPRSEMRESVDSVTSSFSFTTLSEERLQAAIKLAKRDLRRRHLESLSKLSAKPSQEASAFETSDVELFQVNMLIMQSS